MTHPVLDEILRAKLPIRPEVLARWQQAIRNDILPLQVTPKSPAKKDAAA